MCIRDSPGILITFSGSRQPRTAFFPAVTLRGEVLYGEAATEALVAAASEPGKHRVHVVLPDLRMVERSTAWLDEVSQIE